VDKSIHGLLVSSLGCSQDDGGTNTNSIDGGTNAGDGSGGSHSHDGRDSE
jgi:hypothetical protein